ncbi:tyrosine-type recombinase/integrase [Citromicrobium bathyomarinum]
MPRDKITKRIIDAAEPETRDYFIWDTSFIGFGVKVTPRGRKVFVYQYRMPAPGEAARIAPVRYTIGRYGNLTVEQARKRAEQLAGMVANGVDPRGLDKERLAAAKEAKRAAVQQARLDDELAFEKYADRWLDHYENEKNRRPSSVSQGKLVVEAHLKPALGNKPMPHIGRADLQPIIDAIPAKKKATRRMVFSYASVLFGWAMRRGDIDSNPLAAMEKPPAPEARERVLSDAEVKVVWQAAAEQTAPFDSFTRLLLLTGQRRSEVAGMNWTELDRKAATWTIPIARAKNKAAHIVPLSEAVMAELDTLAARSPGAQITEDKKAWPTAGFVLTTNGRSPISGFSKAKAKLDLKVTKANGGQPLPAWRIHDLRRTVATGLQKLGVRLEVTEAVLNHISGSRSGIVGVYQKHQWGDEKRAALNAWAAQIEAIVSERDQCNVVSLDAAKKSA